MKLSISLDLYNRLVEQGIESRDIEALKYSTAMVLSEEIEKVINVTHRSPVDFINYYSVCSRGINPFTHEELIAAKVNPLRWAKILSNLKE